MNQTPQFQEVLARIAATRADRVPYWAPVSPAATAAVRTRVRLVACVLAGIGLLGGTVLFALLASGRLTPVPRGAPAGVLGLVACVLTGFAAAMVAAVSTAVRDGVADVAGAAHYRAYALGAVGGAAMASAIAVCALLSRAPLSVGTVALTAVLLGPAVLPTALIVVGRSELWLRMPAADVRPGPEPGGSA